MIELVVLKVLNSNECKILRQEEVESGGEEELRLGTNSKSNL
jgi:hypothetical protein